MRCGLLDLLPSDTKRRVEYVTLSVSASRILSSFK